jgi:hypothetical protein
VQADFSIFKDKALPLAATVLFALFVVMLLARISGEKFLPQRVVST